MKFKSGNLKEMDQLEDLVIDLGGGELNLSQWNMVAGYGLDKLGSE
jgi:hypothetical protein